MRRSSRLAAVLVPFMIAGATVGVLGSASLAGAANPFAPLDRPGPALTVPAETLHAALKCSGDFVHNTHEPVLLNPATGVTPEQNYSWNYERAFTAQGRPWCAITMPYDTERHPDRR